MGMRRWRPQWFIEGLSIPVAPKIKLTGPDTLTFSIVSERTGLDRGMVMHLKSLCLSQFSNRG